MQKFIGNKAFYRTVLTIAIPIMIQNAITNFVGLLDNLMVGQIGTAQMSGVAIVNQLIFVFNLSIFGIVFLPVVFWYPILWEKGLSRDARCLSFQASGQSFDLFVGDGAAVFAKIFLIRLYLHGTGDSAELTLALTSAKEFLVILLFSLPFLLFLKLMPVLYAKWAKPWCRCLPAVSLSSRTQH